MSCYLLNLSHVDAVLAYAALEARGLSPVRLTVPADADCADGAGPVHIDLSDPEHRDDMGRMIFEANADSLEARYGASGTDNADMLPAILLGRALAESYSFKPSTATTDPATIIGALNCIDHQCDDAESYTMSLVQWTVAAIRRKAAGELAKGWDISDPARDSELPELPAQLDGDSPADGDAEPQPELRAGLLARMSAALSGKAPESPKPAGKAPAGPKPEPETAAKAARSPAGADSKAKGSKGPDKAKSRSTGRKSAQKGKKPTTSGTRAPTPAKNAAAPRAKGKAPATA